MLKIIFWYVILGTLSLIIGDLVLRFLEKKILPGKMPKSIRLAVVFHIVPILGYTIFWIYMLNVTVGVILSCLLFLFVALGGLFQLCRHGRFLFLDDDESIIQTVLMLCLPIIFLLVIALPFDKDKDKDDPTAPYTRIIDFFVAKTPVRGSHDYIIQWIYAESDSPWSITLCPEKHTVADRPPVIGGTTFLFKTPDYFLKPSIKKLDVYYFLGMAVFCCVGWIPACWGLLRSLGIPIRKCVSLIIILGFSSPLIFFSTTFCWPKMLGGTYMLVAYLLVDSDMRAKDVLGRLAIPMAAVFVGFSLLCHMVNALVIPFVLVYLIIKRDIRIFEIVICGIIVSGIVASWFVPKMLFETPHPSLFRYLLTDANNKDIYFNNSSDFQAIVDSYKQHSMKDILTAKYTLIRNSLPPLKLTREGLLNPENLFTSQGYVLIATAVIGLLFFFRTTSQCRNLYLKKLICYMLFFIFAYVVLVTISYWCTPGQTIFPTSALLFYSLALLLGAAFLHEKCLWSVAGATFILWLYLYLDYALFIQYALIIAGGVLFFAMKTYARPRSRDNNHMI